MYICVRVCVHSDPQTDWVGSSRDLIKWWAQAYKKSGNRAKVNVTVTFLENQGKTTLWLGIGKERMWKW